MKTKLNLSKVTKMQHFSWTPDKERAAILLAQGLTQQKVADAISKHRLTIVRWLRDIGFSAEVDRLSVLADIASKAERLRITKRVVRQKMKHSEVQTKKDLLEWLKFAQSETANYSFNPTVI